MGVVPVGSLMAMLRGGKGGRVLFVSMGRFAFSEKTMRIERFGFCKVSIESGPADLTIDSSDRVQLNSALSPYLWLQLHGPI